MSRKPFDLKWWYFAYSGTLRRLWTSPPLIRFGTSTWTYEGWQGQIYKREYKKTLLVL
jgi:hypothetical protein